MHLNNCVEILEYLVCIIDMTHFLNNYILIIGRCVYYTSQFTIPLIAILLYSNTPVRTVNDTTKYFQEYSICRVF